MNSTSAHKAGQKTSLLKRATFVEEQKKSIISGLGTYPGSFIQEEQTPNNVSNDHQTKASSRQNHIANPRKSSSIDIKDLAVEPVLIEADDLQKKHIPNSRPYIG